MGRERNSSAHFSATGKLPCLKSEEAIGILEVNGNGVMDAAGDPLLREGGHDPVPLLYPNGIDMVDMLCIVRFDGA